MQNQNYIFLSALIVVIMVVVIQSLFILPIGFISDDFTLIHSAKTQSPLWSLHYSPVMEFLWNCTASGSMTALTWRIIAFSLHLINGVLLFAIARQGFRLAFLPSFFAGILFLLNPAGLEAVVWSCSLGYVATATWLFSSMYIFLNFHKGRVGQNQAWISIVLALMQIGAFFTWDWGIVLFPVLAVFAMTNNSLWKAKWLLAPMSFCWGIGTLIRLSSQYQLSWQHNSFIKMSEFLLGSPFLGLFPNFEKGFYSTVIGISLSLVLLGYLFWISYHNRMARACLLSYCICVYPWISGGNPSGRYFYIPMTFIYLILAIVIEQMRQLHVKIFVPLFIGIAMYLSYERAHLWNLAYFESRKLLRDIEQIAAGDSPKKLLIVNLPDAFGPTTMSMRPQMWFSGFQSLFPDIKVLKTKDCPFVWHFGRPVSRSHIAANYSDHQIYEVVLDPASDQFHYQIISYSDSESKFNEEERIRIIGDDV
jgi:hypothetical protein